MQRTDLQPRNPLPILVAISLGALALAGCAGNEDMANDLSALKVGQISATPLPRAVFDADLSQSCGTGEGMVEAAEVLKRKPYLQQTDHDSTLLVWTSSAERALEVVVTTPDGEPVAQVGSEIDTSAQPRDGRQYIASLEGLTPATTYCYQLLADGRPATARTGFRTAPEPGSTGPVTFVAVGDMGTGKSDQHAVFDQIRNVPFELLLALGDNAYESGTLDEFEMHLFDVYGPVFRSVPVFPISGNHEYHTRDAAPFREVFVLPENGGEQGRERWYSFDWGPIHFVALDTEKTGAAQAAWLEQDLAANTLPWIIILAHRPPYSSGKHGSHVAFRHRYGEILERYNVQLVLSGHEHSYERTRSINGTTYVVSGGGGRETRGIGSSSFTEFSEAVLHFTWFRVDGDTLEMRAVDGTGKEFDSMILKQKREDRLD